MKLLDFIFHLFGISSKAIIPKIDENKLSSVANIIASPYEDTSETVTESIIIETILPCDEVPSTVAESSYSTPSSFPISIETSVLIFPISIEEIEIRSDKGVTEDFFYDHLIRLFPKNIFNNKKPSNTKYTPDFVYIDKENGIYIVIEIDEPYTVNNGALIPIHTKGSDDARNQFFLNNGWDIVRFAEEQIARYPDSCVAFLADHINNTANGNLKPLDCWDDHDVQIMITNRHRNSYLPFELKDNERSNSQNSLRSFHVEDMTFVNERDSVIMYLTKNDNQKEGLDCWIDRNTFCQKFKYSNLGIIWMQRNLPLNLMDILFISGDIKLTAYGNVKGCYFNVNRDTIILTYPDSTIELFSPKPHKRKSKNGNSF